MNCPQMLQGALWSSFFRRLGRDSTGASMVEFAIVFPVFGLLAFGAVDLGYAFYQWNAAAKATHRGARAAAVLNPVATGLNNLTATWSLPAYSGKLGLPCSNPTTGVIT